MKPFSALVTALPRQLAPMRTDVLRGGALERMIHDELDQLASRCAAPATARGTWLTATVRAVPEPDPWGVVVRDAEGEARAAAVLLDGRDGEREVVALAGSATGHRSAVLAESAPAAALLGHAVAEVLVARGKPTTVVLGPVDGTTPWLAEFAATIPGGEVAEVAAVPAIRRAASADANDYLSASMRRMLRKAANRLRADGHTPTVRFTGDFAEIVALLPALQDVHRARSHGQGRASELDDPVGRRIWNSRIVALAEDGLLEVATIAIAGRIAAQVIALVEPTSYGVLEGFMVSDFSRYAAGRVLETAVLQRFLDDPAKDRLDWMTSVAPESLLAANEEQRVSVVRAAW
jgi:Acetyltransferase (GNAT) domain